MGCSTHYCGCDSQIHSVVDISDGSDVQVVSPEHATAWEDLYVPSIPPHARIPTKHRQKLHLLPQFHMKERHHQYQITPHFDPDQGDPSPEEPAIGVATKVEAKERMTQTPPIQGYPG